MLMPAKVLSSSALVFEVGEVNNPTKSARLYETSQSSFQPVACSARGYLLDPPMDDAAGNGFSVG